MSVKTTRPDFRSDRGSTMVSTLGALVIGVLVLGGLSSFWLNSTKSADRNQDVSQQQTAALRVLNGVTGDVSSADGLVSADSQSIVIQRRDAAGKYVRVRYAMDKTSASNIKIVRTTNRDVPFSVVAANYSAATSFPSTLVPKIIASKATDQVLFTYFDKKGAKLSAPLDGAKMMSARRVDVSFTADAGKGKVALTSKAALPKPGGGTGNDPNAPALQCPATFTAAWDSDLKAVVLQWSAVDGASSYGVMKNGSTLLGVVSSTSTLRAEDRPTAGSTNTYRIITQSASGEFNGDCVTRTVEAPQAQAALRGQVTDDLQKMQISWDAIPNVTGYILTARETNPANVYEPTGAWLPIFDSTSALTYTHDPGLGRSYEYKLMAVANNRWVESNTFVLLNAAAPPSLSANVVDYSVNQVTLLGADATTTDWMVRRVQRAATASAPVNDQSFDGWVPAWPDRATTTLRDELITNPGINNPDQSQLGYAYWYSGVAGNSGPRTNVESDAKQATWMTGPWGDFVSSAKALQYPNDPTTTAVGTELGNPDGTNTARWSGARGADSFELWKTYRNVKGSYEAAAGTRFFGVGAATSYTDTSASLNKPGTRHFYMAVAKNATGFSPNQQIGSTARAAAYQRPRAVTVAYNLGKRPSEATDITGPAGQSEGNRFEVDWRYEGSALSPDYPQENQPAEYRFCDEPDAGGCSYSTSQNGNVVKYTDRHDKSYSGYASGYGVKDALSVHACNRGGCSQKDMPVLTYPGPFAIQTVSQTPQNIFAYQRSYLEAESKAWSWSTNDALKPNENGFASTTFTWSQSQGAGMYTAHRSQPGAFGLSDIQEMGTTGLTTGKWNAQPSKKYQIQVVAFSQHDMSLSRYADARISERNASTGQTVKYGFVKMSPPPASRNENVRMCARGGNYNVVTSVMGSRLQYNDTTWNPTANEWQMNNDVGGISHWAVWGKVPNPYRDANGNNSGWDSATDPKMQKVLRHGTPRLLAGPVDLGIGHGYGAGTFGPVAAGAGAFGMFTEDLTGATSTAGSYVIHGLRSDVSNAGTHWGDGMGLYWMDVDYRQEDLDHTSDGLCGWADQPSSWVTVSSGNSLQRRGSPTQIWQSTLGWQDTPRGGAYSKNVYGPVVGFGASEQPAS